MTQEMTDMVVVQLDNARRALMEAKTIQETKKILDVSAAAEIYAKRQQLGEEAIRYATEIKLEALAQLGRMLKDTPRNTGSKGQLKGDVVSGTKLEPPTSNIPTYAELGLDKRTAKLAQDIASLPDEEMDKVKKGVVSLTRVQHDIRKNNLKPVQNSNQLPANIKLLEGDIFEKIQEVPDKSIDLLITDPPYMVMNDYEWDDKDLQFLHNWLTAIEPTLKDSFNGFIFCDARMQYEYETVIRNHFDIKNKLIWIRKNMAMGRVVKDRFISSYEVIFFIGNRELNLPESWGSERFDSFEFAVPQSNFNDTKLHPTQKPLGLFTQLVKVGSFPGDSILDCFAGSGTTGAACLKTGDRDCYLIEKEHEYVEVIRNRINGMG